MNTIHEHGITLSEKEKAALVRKADSMEYRIREFFRYTDKAYTAENIHRGLFHTGLLTSVRRSLSNLKNEGFLEKTQHKHEGSHRVRIHTYRRATPKEVIQEKLF